MASAELLLHPVRLRIIQSLLDGSVLTTAELSAALPDVPVATLYRHVAKLSRAGVLAVASETRVRGAVQRRYRLHHASAVVDAEQSRTMAADEHRQAFTVFVATLLADFDRYLAGPDRDFAQDDVGYHMAALWLTDDELNDLRDEFAVALTARMANKPTAARRKRILSTILIPADR
jgi:DNA-binding transcriptional ArsR family regulator